MSQQPPSLESMSLVKIHKQYIKGTKPKAPVVESTILLCNLTIAVFKTDYFKSLKVHINTIVLKHLYDKKPAEEYEFIIHNLFTIVKYPNHLYRNKTAKRGEIVFVKEIEGNNYLCSIETMTFTHTDGSTEEINHIATAFRVRDENYLKGYELLWSWKGGNPSS